MVENKSESPFERTTEDKIIDIFSHWRDHYSGEKGERPILNANLFGVRQALHRKNLDDAGIKRSDLTRETCRKIVELFKEVGAGKALLLTVNEVTKDHFASWNYEDIRLRRILAISRRVLKEKLIS